MLLVAAFDKVFPIVYTPVIQLSGVRRGNYYAIKRGKIAFCQALPIKFAVRIFRMSEASRTNEAERVEFSRLSIIRLKAYSARKEGRTDPLAGAITTIAERSLCFIVCYCKAVNGWSATRSCEWVGAPYAIAK